MHEFELLADPTRRRIVELLAHQELSVVVLAGRMGDRFPVSRSAVSHQLRVLRDADFWENRVGWPYETLLPEPPPRLHRAGRRDLRGRTRSEIEPRAAAEDWWSYLSD